MRKKNTKLSPAPAATLSIKSTSPAPQANVLSLVEEIQKFNHSELATKKEELDKVIAHLEHCLGSVLVPREDKDSDTSSALLGHALGSENQSPLSGAIQTIRGDSYDTHNFIEIMRNRISGIIDRIHL